MTIGTIDESQRKAARLVGSSYLFALPPAIFAELYVRARLIASATDPGNSHCAPTR
jgi:hypothetical protein